jgi:hypothetical protein
MNTKVIEHYNDPFLIVGDYVFSYAYPISFVGALFYGVSAILNVDPSTIVANRNISVALNIIIGVCGMISLFVFLKIKIPIFGPILLPNGSDTIKQNIISVTKYN